MLSADVRDRHRASTRDAQRERPRSARYARTAWAERRLYRTFVVAALAVAVTLGFTTGAAMLAWSAVGTPGEAWLTYLQPHGMAQLFGWAGLFAMGVSMHVVPRFRGDAAIRYPWPQRAILGLVLAAIALRAAGQAAHASEVSASLLVLADVALLAGVLLYAAVIGGVLRGGGPSSVRVEHWLWAGLAWAVVAAALHLWIVVEMAREGAPAADPTLDRAFVWTALAGFVGAFIFAVSRRAVAGFLALRPVHPGLDALAWALVNGGLAWLVLTSALDAGEAASGLLLLAAGWGAFVASLRVLEPSARAAALSPGSYPRFGWFLRVAYAWLVVGAALLALSALDELSLVSAERLSAAPALHTVAVGFVSMAIVGFATRALPLFEGRSARWFALLDVAFVALNASTALRLAFGTLDLPVPQRGLAASGALGLLGIACFAAFAVDLLRPWRRDAGDPCHISAAHAPLEVAPRI